MSSELQHLISEIRPIDVRAALFKKGDFDFIVKKEINGEVKEHKKQREALEILTSNTVDKFLYGGGAGSAKAQPLDAKIYTPFGFKKMGDIKVGDVIKSPSGGNTNVIGVHPQGKKKIYEIEFIDGAKTKACGEHLWKVWYAGNMSKQEIRSGKGKIQTTEMLIKNLHKNPIIPLCEPLEFTLPINKYITPVWDKINPYVLGCLIGDGGLTKQVGFSTSDLEIINHIKERIDSKFIVNKLTGDYAYSITQNERNEKGFGINEMYECLKNLGLNCKSEFKFIPKEYFHAPLKHRIELVQGLMDTDGTIDAKGHCEYSTSSCQLALDFQYILRGLGFKVTLRKNKTTHLDNYKLYIQGNNPSLLFKLERKKERIRKFNGGVSESGRRILSIKEIGYEECQCITVDSLDRLYITDDFIVTHNTWTGCCWLLFMCINYPGIRCFVARNELKDIVDSVYVTFVKVCHEYGFQDYKFNSVKNFIQFGNGSYINFIEIKYKPSDPDFQDLGSTEYTIGWQEEGGEINEMGATVLMTRVGRHMNDKYNLKGVVLITCNPAQNWLKIDFYDPWSKSQLPKEMAYLPALVTDNPFIPQNYIENLKLLAKKSRSLHERLFRGNWNYVDSANALVDRDMVDAIFTNDHVPRGKWYITCDVARFGADKAVIMVWCGWRVVSIKTFDISKTTDIELAIRTFRYKYKIPRTRCVGDADGVGGGLIDGAGIIGFHNNARPVRMGKDTPNFRNIKVQCMYYLADIINEGGLYIEEDCDISIEQKTHITQEVFQIESNNRDDRKLDTKSKSEIKQAIGRSPDYLDTLLLRSYFDLKKGFVELETTWR